MNLDEKRIKKKYGMRKGGGIPLFEPQELGYRCPRGHSYITWSEFDKHIWCYICKKDYHSLNDCILIEDPCNPKNLPKMPRIIKGIGNWTKDGNHFNDVPKRLL